MLEAPPPFADVCLSRLFLENVKDYAIFTADPNSRVLSWNSGAERILGYEESEILGQPTSILFTEHDRAQGVPEGVHENALRKGKAEGRHWHVRKDGSRLWGEWTVIPLYDPQNGELRGYGKLLRDLTDRKRTDDSLKMQALILDQMTEGVSVADEEGYIRYTNPAEDAMFGYERGELIGQHLSVKNPSTLGEVPRSIDEVIARLKQTGSWEGDLESVRRNGARFIARSRITGLELHEKKYWVCVQEDVTDQRMAREFVRDREQRLRFALESAQAGEWEIDLDTLETRRSHEHDHIFGYPEARGSWSYREFLNHVLPEAREAVIESFRKALASGSWEIECPIRRRDGELRWIWVRGRVHHDPEGRARSMHGLLGDITERKQAEEALRQSEELRNRIVQSSQDCIVILDLEGRLLSMSESGRRGLGMEELAPFIARSWVDFWTGADRDAAARAVQAARSGGVGRFTGFFPTQSGAPKWWDVILSPILGANRKPYRLLCVSRDITQIKEAETLLKQRLDELVRSNSELARFAHAASHDLKEPLRMVTSFVRLLERKYQDKLDEEAKRYIDFAVEGATRMYALLDGLLALSQIRGRPEPMRVVDCNEVVDRVLSDSRSCILKEGAEVTTDPMPTVYGDPAQLYQIFQNLISNALKFHGLGSPKIHIGVERNGADWIFSVSDNGIGIDAQYAERIFSVFQRLNARELYPGSGIGLAICRKVIERHGGKIWLESDPGQGATFYFTLPAHERELAEPPALAGGRAG